MATTVTNKTHKPLSLPLSRGKKLFLGPGKSGEIAANDAERPNIKALVESGTIELEHVAGRAGGADSGSKGKSSQNFGANRGSHRGGDR